MPATEPTRKFRDPVKIAWYRVPVARAELNALNQRDDWQGTLQVAGHLGLVAMTGLAAWYAAAHLPLFALLPILLLHCTFYVFLYNGSHELSHNTVFKTKMLNILFMRIFSFLVWRNHLMFSTSHVEHHKYTLHPPDDLEVELPMELTVAGFLKNAVVNPWNLYDAVRVTIRLSLGRLEGEWEHALFPPEAAQKRRELFAWARLLLLGHGLILAVSIYFGWWLLPVLISLAPFCGGWLRYLCNNLQHAGLQDNVPDFRLCCRTVYLNPFTSFLYWQMNYHTEHHMYAGVPCYNLPKLHRRIESEMPECKRGLLAAWKEIIVIMRKQKADPAYQHVPDLPPPAPESRQPAGRQSPALASVVRP